MILDFGNPSSNEMPSSPAQSVPSDLSTMNELGLQFHEEQRFDRSLEQFWLSLVRARELGHRDWECVALNNIGMVYQSWGKFDHAMKFYKQSLQVSEKTGFVHGSMVGLNNLGRLYDTWGWTDRALEYYEKSLALAKAHREVRAERIAMLNMAMCLEKAGDFSRCRELLREIVGIDAVIQHPNEAMDRAYLAHLDDRP
jgi:tetratricopeptide (TPR) repeat protein